MTSPLVGDISSLVCSLWTQQTKQMPQPHDTQLCDALTVNSQCGRVRCIVGGLSCCLRSSGTSSLSPGCWAPVPLRSFCFFLVQGGPVEILPFLYLGSAYHAARRDMLDALGITALLNVSSDCPNHFEGHYQYKCIPVEDNHKADISSWFMEAIEYIGRLPSLGVAG